MDFDATAQVDQILANYEASRLIIWITLGVIVVALIALGTEFWVNLFGVIFSPSLTFQRILGEAQTVPGLVIIAITGMACGAIVNGFLSNEVIVQKIVDTINSDMVKQGGDQLDQVFKQTQSDFSLVGNLDYVREYIFQAQSLAVAIPIAFLVAWILWGLAGQLASMIAGNKAGHGITNLWSAIPYIWIFLILSTWLSMLQMAGRSGVNIIGLIVGLFMVFIHVVMMREHGRYSIANAVISTVLTGILYPILLVVVTILIVGIVAQAAIYL
ncbi:MAG: hypothetical protein NTY09_06385 [bacterium]|nr:hypothetical protein [bacterium]